MNAPRAATPRSSTARVVGRVVFGVIVATLTTVFSTQILVQAWSTPAGVATECHEGLRVMLERLARARQSAAKQTGELAALSAFRAALGDAWGARSGLDRACASDPLAARMLRALSSLRYAEEHAVRYESQELAVRRRDVEAMARELFPDLR